jgi:glycosyltransferase involved in cell wall biosynthesis
MMDRTSTRSATSLSSYTHCDQHEVAARKGSDGGAVRPTRSTPYSALVRTFNCEHTLPGTLAALSWQTEPPTQLVCVDSGSTDHTLNEIPTHVALHHYVGDRFNYSAAINQGLEYVNCDLVAIVSSHSSLQNPHAIAYALDLLHSHPNIGAVYFDASVGSKLEHDIISGTTFDGFNGLWNTFSLIRMSLLRERSFRPEVFSAEDQDWAAWLFAHKSMTVACIHGGGLINRSFNKGSMRKRLNEYVAVAYYVKPELRSLPNLIRLAMSTLRPPGQERRRFRERLFYALTLLALLRSARHPHAI